MVHEEPTRAHAPARGPFSRLFAVLDYDGTVTTDECNEIAMQRFVGDAWRPFEREVNAGRMGHAECFDKQIRLVQAPRAEFFDTLVTAAKPAPGLAAFLTTLGEGGGRAAVLSAGFREAIEHVWRREALPPVQVYASELVGRGPHGEAPFHMVFSDALGDCPRCGPSSCKGAAIRELRLPGDVVVVFGDGSSDLCAAREADVTFAHGRLAELCTAEALPWQPLDYGEATRALARLAASDPPPREAS